MDTKLDKIALSYLNCDAISLSEKGGLLARPLNDKSTLLLVVDMVNGFCKKGALYSERIEALIPRVKEALELLDSAERVFIRDEHPEDAVEFKSFPPHCHTAKESKIVPELAGFKHIDVAKNSTNGFFNLSKVVYLGGYSHIMIMGCCTDICIMQLALTLKAYLNETGLATPVTVFTDYVETYDSSVHSAELSNLFALKNMEAAGISIFKNLI